MFSKLELSYNTMNNFNDNIMTKHFSIKTFYSFKYSMGFERKQGIDKFACFYFQLKNYLFILSRSFVVQLNYYFSAKLILIWLFTTVI